MLTLLNARSNNAREDCNDDLGHSSNTSSYRDWNNNGKREVYLKSPAKDRHGAFVLLCLLLVFFGRLLRVVGARGRT